MNSLSIFIYLAEVIGTLKGMLIFLTVLTWIGLGITILVWAFNLDINDRLVGLTRQLISKYVWVPLVTSLVMSLTPSQQTVYLIAASELGQYTWESEEGQEIYNDLKTIIRNYANLSGEEG